MRYLKRVAAIFVAFAMVFTSMGNAYAMYYNEYTPTNNVSIYSSSEEYVNMWNYKTYRYDQKNAIRFTLNWQNVGAYSFDGSNWYGNCSSRKTFFIVENYYTDDRWNGTEVVMPKSVNVLFVYVKDYNQNVRLFTYKLSKSELEHIYAPNDVPWHIINVTEMIDSLPLKSDLRLADESKVLAARAAYETLSARDKSLVYNIHKLYDLETKLDELKSTLVDWTKIFKDLDMNATSSGKLTEQYYSVPDQLYADLYVNADKSKIYQTKLGDPRYNRASISEHVLKDTTPNSENVFFIYDYNNYLAKNIWSKAMAKKVWGFFYPSESGKYQFRITSDDGHSWQMYLNNGTDPTSDTFNIQNASTTISSKYDLHNISSFDTSLYALKANTPYPIFIEYFNHGGNAALKLQYKMIKDNGISTGWVNMQGGMFKPSTAYEFGFKAGNASGLLDIISKAEEKVIAFSKPGMIGSTEGQVSQAALDALKQKLALAKLELERAQKNMLTQAQIDEATQKLKIALDEFNNAIVKKPNGVTAPFAAQQAAYLHVAFDKDKLVNTYEIIISTDNQISPDDTLYKVTNSLYNLNGSTKVTVKEGDLSGELYMKDSTTPNGRYQFMIPLGERINGQAVNVFIRTATNENKGDASAKTITILKPVTEFKYASVNNQVTFYAGELVGETGFAFAYYPKNSDQLKEVYLVANGKGYVTIPADEVDLTRIGDATAYRIKLNGSTPSANEGRSIGVSNPKRLEVNSVQNLKLTNNNGVYNLTWDQFPNAIGYEVFEGNTVDVNQMAKWNNALNTNSVTLSNINDGNMHYYAVRAILSDDIFKNSGLSNVVKAYKPSQPELYSLGDAARMLTPPETTNYVIKGDGTTKGYYLITMPSDLLKLNAAANVAQDSNGDYEVIFTEAKDTVMKFKYQSAIPWSKANDDQQSTGSITYKVPYDKGDVGFTVEAIKNKLTAASSSQISVVKVVEGLSVQNTWAVGKTYAIGDRVVSNGYIYACRQAHTVHANDLEPKLAPALWSLIDAAGQSNESIQGTSDPSVVNVNVQVTPPDVKKDVAIKNGSSTTINGNVISTKLGADFEIQYNLQLSAKDIYNPNFVFDFVENDYFSFDYPTVTAEVVLNGVVQPLTFQTQVVKKVVNETVNGIVRKVSKTEVTLITEDDFNFGNQVVNVTLKVKPVVKNNPEMLKIAKDAKIIKDNEDWKLAYVIGELKKGDVLLIDGLSILNHTEFNTFANSPNTVKEIKTPEETLKLNIKSEIPIKSVH